MHPDHFEDEQETLDNEEHDRVVNASIEKAELPILNQQPPEKQSDSDGRFLEVEDVWPTIQGEGNYNGTRAIFIRLSGCNLQCPQCDAIYTKVRKKMMPWQILEELVRLSIEMKKITMGMQLGELNKDDAVVLYKEDRPLIVMTGGEPFRQPISGLARALINAGWSLQIETNGTYYDEDFPYERVSIVVSPKTGKINPQLAERLKPHKDIFKYIISADHIDLKDGLPTSVLGNGIAPARPVEGIPVFVQPADEEDGDKVQANLLMAANSVMAFGYRLSIQVHKIVGMP